MDQLLLVFFVVSAHRPAGTCDAVRVVRTEQAITGVAQTRQNDPVVVHDVVDGPDRQVQVRMRLQQLSDAVLRTDDGNNVYFRYAPLFRYIL